jgi:hypothetical protein
MRADGPPVFDLCGPLPEGTTVLEASAGTGSQRETTPRRCPDTGERPRAGRCPDTGERPRAGRPGCTSYVMRPR